MTRNTASMLVISFLDHPYGDHSASIEPIEMRKTLELIDQSAAPCDESGIPR